MILRSLAALAATILLGAPATAAEYSMSEVRLPVEGAVLAGKLYRPAGGASPRPAVVLIAGSRTSPNLRGVAEHLAENGVVVLALAKRGVDGSTGTWRSETIEERAGDTLAGVTYLAAESGVDRENVGIVGHSQGAWVAQLAAAQSESVRYLVLLAGPAQTVREQVLTDERIHLVRRGVPEPIATARVGLLDLTLRVALNNPVVCGRTPRHYLCGLRHYDPSPALARVKVPVLALYGGKDPMAPPELNVDRLQAALRKNGGQEAMVRVFPEANHLFWPAKSGLRDEYEDLSHEYVEGFLDTISGWVLSTSARPRSPTAEDGHAGGTQN